MVGYTGHIPKIQREENVTKIGDAWRTAAIEYDCTLNEPVLCQ